MKAIVWTKYGSPDVLQLREVEKPTPKDNEVLIKTHAATITAGDCEFRALKFPLWLTIPIRFWIGFRKPVRNTILGMEVAGEIEAVGKDVTRFKVGDQVFGMTGMTFGGYAEYVCVPAEAPEGLLTLKPPHMTYEEVVPLPVGGFEALHFLQLANIQPSQKVLINGAGGSIGTAAVQLAKYFGAEVTAVDKGEKLAMLRGIGADHTIDYTQTDYTQNGAVYDVIFDVAGKSHFGRSVKSLSPTGCYMIANLNLGQFLRGRWVEKTSQKKVIMTTSSGNVEKLTFLKTLMEEGKIKPVVDRRYPLEHIPEAHKYVESGRKQGNVVVTVSH